MAFVLTIAYQPAQGAAQQWTRGANTDRPYTSRAHTDRPYTSRAHARAGLKAYKRGLLAHGWEVADGCDYADSFALGLTDGRTRIIAEVTQRDHAAPAGRYTPPAGTSAAAMLDALDKLEATYTASLEGPNARGAEFAQWVEQRQGIRAAIACARAAYADHNA